MTKIDDAAMPAPLATETIVTGRQPRSRRRSAFRRPMTSIVRHTLLIALALAMLYPVIWMVVSSLRPNDEIFRDPSIIPDSFEISNYTDGWNALAYPFNVYMWNSALIVIGCIVGNLVSCSMAAYAFARLSFSGKRFWFAVMLLSIMLPIHVIIVPQYVLFSQLGWVNTFLPLIVPKLLATDAFFIFLMVQFIRGIPKELDEAARIDGAGHPRIFLQIILPLMVPALATTAIFTFIWTWNDFFSQLIFLTKPELYTVPLALRSFEDAQSSTNYAQMFAMSVVSLIPIFLIFLFGQKFLIKGIATTGIK
ncbi:MULTISPECIES: carbohydrate ABC transporter permease [Microbacterium]|uniref:L-arabinose transport system permease protein AraQ n=1 Tax=Microbacterium trichothecenolyticum TaxID=69370 RepID=A0A0M2HBG9_MICTR|nr:MULTISPECIES: carbohydrate ABC transporter permease [Microbacterium]KJL41542.1 L-arabinose transport system permease protein AraQ [Microbacterium trichothecenolyticum]MDR7190617.1 multiple sugar transport system permease protein [Microbacterium sp. BE35]